MPKGVDSHGFASGAIPHRGVAYRPIDEPDATIAVEAVWPQDDRNPLRYRLLSSFASTRMTVATPPPMSPRRPGLQYQIAADQYAYPGARPDGDGRLHIELMLDQLVARPLHRPSCAVADGERDVVVVAPASGDAGCLRRGSVSTNSSVTGCSLRILAGRPRLRPLGETASTIHTGQAVQRAATPPQPDALPAAVQGRPAQHR